MRANVLIMFTMCMINNNKTYIFHQLLDFIIIIRVYFNNIFIIIKN